MYLPSVEAGERSPNFLRESTFFPHPTDCQLVKTRPPARIRSIMSDPRKNEKFNYLMAAVFVVLAVAALLITFAVMATIGDDTPTELPAPTQTSSGE